MDVPRWKKIFPGELVLTEKAQFSRVSRLEFYPSCKYIVHFRRLLPKPPPLSFSFPLSLPRSRSLVTSLLRGLGATDSGNSSEPRWVWPLPFLVKLFSRTRVWLGRVWKLMKKKSCLRKAFFPLNFMTFFPLVSQMTQGRKCWVVLDRDGIYVVKRCWDQKLWGCVRSRQLWSWGSLSSGSGCQRLQEVTGPVAGLLAIQDMEQRLILLEKRDPTRK